ncbi:MAG: aldo/keto reductase [Erysipelotrichaceae bacterium]
MNNQLFKTLNNGVKMPIVGIGTFLLSPQQAEQSVLWALQSGYRLIDTANAYLNEKAVGRAIKASNVARNEIFVETKLWPSLYQQSDALDKTLERLDCDYIDLLLIHQPAGDYISGYRMMEKGYKQGKVRAIGLSNFKQEQIEEILSLCEVKPAVLQSEVHPYYQENQLKEMLAAEGIALQSWYPLGHGDKNLLEENIFSSLAQKYHKSNAQIILRWHIQSGNIVIPGSNNLEHIKDNIDLFDFSLTAEELAAINKLDCNKPYYISNPQMLQQYANKILPLDEQI